MRIDLTEQQKAEVAEIMALNWGGHMQTGHDQDDFSIIHLWTKMGPNVQAYDHAIHPDGTVIRDGVEWDGRAH